MTIDIVSTSGDTITVEDVGFHPLVKAELHLELKKWEDALKKVSAERLQSVQGKVEILEWVLNRMLSEVVQKERERRKGLENA